MSFRFISALPTCLHGRPVVRPANLRHNFSTYYHSNSVFANAIAAEHHNGRREHDSLNQNVKELYTDSEKQRIVAAHQQKTGHDVQTNGAPTLLESKTTSNPDLDVQARLGATLDIPDFVRNRVSRNNAKTTRVTSVDGSLPEPNQAETSGGGYRQWEELHDKYLEVRRTRPSEINEIFKEQREFAKTLLGDITLMETAALDFQRKWAAMDSTEQIDALPALLIGSMTQSAAHALFVLSNVDNFPYSYLIRMNCLRSIGLVYAKFIHQNPELKARFEAMIGKFRSPNKWPNKKLPAVLLQTLLFWSTPEQCQQIIRDFSVKYPAAQASATLAIVDHYLRIEDREQAFEHFQNLPEKSLHQPEAFVINLRDRLLRLDYVAENETGTNFKYLPKVLALGVPSDEALHNTVIESAILNKLPDVAWDVYQYLETSQFHSNARSNLVLLRDSFLRGDLSRVNQVMTTMNSREDLLSDEYLLAYAMNIVRNISCYEKGLPPHEAQRHIMALYDRAYDRSSLVRLGIVQPIDESLSLQQPSATLLAFTIWTHILVQRNDAEILSLWEWVKHLIVNGDSAITQAATYDVIYNGFILYHARKAKTLFRSMDVVQYMLSGDLCPPTPRTWSIIMCAFLRHDQPAQAEKIMALMQRRGHKVDVISERYGKYIPVGYDIDAMAAAVSKNLDERNVPEGLEEMMALSSPSGSIS